MPVIARAHRTITDLYDPIQQATAPTNPIEGMLWLDTETSELKKYTWDGEEHIWAIATGGELSEQMQEQVAALLEQLKEAEKAAKDAQDAADEANVEAGLVRKEVEASIENLGKSITAKFTEANTYIDTVNGATNERVEVIESHVKIEPGAKVTLGASNQATEMVLTPGRTGNTRLRWRNTG